MPVVTRTRARRARQPLPIAVSYNNVTEDLKIDATPSYLPARDPDCSVTMAKDDLKSECKKSLTYETVQFKTKRDMGVHVADCVKRNFPKYEYNNYT